MKIFYLSIHFTCSQKNLNSCLKNYVDLTLFISKSEHTFPAWVTYIIVYKHHIGVILQNNRNFANCNRI